MITKAFSLLRQARAQRAHYYRHWLWLALPFALWAGYSRKPLKPFTRPGQPLHPIDGLLVLAWKARRM